MQTADLHDALSDLARVADSTAPTDRLARVHQRARRRAQVRATAIAVAVLVVAGVAIGASGGLGHTSSAPPASSGSPTPTVTNSTPQASTSPTSSPPTSTPVAVVVNTPIQAAQAYIASQGGGSNQVYRVQAQLKGFALVDVNQRLGTGTGPGSFVIEKVIGDAWKVIYAGQNTPPQSVIDRYAIPESIWCPGGGCGSPPAG